MSKTTKITAKETFLYLVSFTLSIVCIASLIASFTQEGNSIFPAIALGCAGCAGVENSIHYKK